MIKSALCFGHNVHTSNAKRSILGELHFQGKCVHVRCRHFMKSFKSELENQLKWQMQLQACDWCQSSVDKLTQDNFLWSFESLQLLPSSSNSTLKFETCVLFVAFINTSFKMKANAACNNVTMSYACPPGLIYCCILFLWLLWKRQNTFLILTSGDLNSKGSLSQKSRCPLECFMSAAVTIYWLLLQSHKKKSREGAMETSFWILYP